MDNRSRKITFRPFIYKKIEALSESEKRSFSNTVNYLLKKYFESSEYKKNSKEPYQFSPKQ